MNLQCLYTNSILWHEHRPTRICRSPAPRLFVPQCIFTFCCSRSVPHLAPDHRQRAKTILSVSIEKFDCPLAGRFQGRAARQKCVHRHHFRFAFDRLAASEFPTFHLYRHLPHICSGRGRGIRPRYPHIRTSFRPFSASDAPATTCNRLD